MRPVPRHGGHGLGACSGVVASSSAIGRMRLHGTIES
jgi:hypothetical protein